MTETRTTQPGCLAIMKSHAQPGHLHTCIGVHDEIDFHFCPTCRRWWWHRPDHPFTNQ